MSTTLARLRNLGLGHKILLGVVVAVVAVAAVMIAISGRVGVCSVAGRAVGLVRLSGDAVPGCGGVRAYLAGRRELQHNPRQAFASFDAAIAARASWGAAHAGRGEAAEALGEFDAALAAYQQAIALAPSPDHHLRLANLAGRMGRTDEALQALARVRPTLWQRGREAVAGAIRDALGCAVDVRARGGSAVLMCPKPAWTGARLAWRASLEWTPQHAFVLLLEAGRRDEALKLARERGWTAPGIDHCAPSRETLVSGDTSALLAILAHPERADCAIGNGTQMVDGGLVRLGRFILADRAVRGGTEAARQSAARWLRYRLPAHEVPKLAESLNVAGYRLQHTYKRPDDAILVYQRSIAADPKFSWPYHNVGRVYLERNQDPQSLDWIGKALAANPDHWRAWKSYGAALYGLKRYGDAAAAFAQALRIEPNDADALADLGRALLKLGREAEGIRAVQEAVRLDPTLTRERQFLDSRLGRDARQAPTATAPPPGTRRVALDPARALDRARAAFDAGRYVEALDEARAATTADPNSMPAALMRAHAAAFVGELAEARAWHAKAAGLAPDDPRRLYLAATFAVQVGGYDEAVRLLDRLVAIQPTRTRLLFAYAPVLLQPWVRQTNPALDQVVQVKIDVLLEKGDLAGARRLARGHGIVRSGAGYCGQARDRMGKGDRDAIFQAFRLSVLGEPEAADCIWWYGQWLADEGYLTLGRLMVTEGARATGSQGNKDSAARFIRVRLGREVPKAAEHLFQIARQRYLRDGDVEGAVRLFDEAARLAPGFARSHLYRARMAEEGGDLAGAAAWLERAIAADADAWRAHRNLGMLLARQERWAEAERSLRRTVELFDEDPGARLALARVLYAQGKHAEFAKYARAAVQFATQWRGGEQVAEVRAFLEKFDRWGPGAALPPAPDPQVLLGWNYD